MPSTVDPSVALALALDHPAAGVSSVRGLVRVARTLAAVPDPTIDPAFAARLEARLLTEGLAPSVDPERNAVVIALPRRRFVLRKTVAASLAAAMLMAVPVVASASSLPGSPFYAVKTRIERMHLWLTRGAVADGFVHLRHADRRLDEVDQLVALGTTRLVPATLARLESSLQSAAALILANAQDDANLRRLAQALRRSTVRLTGIVDEAPMTVRLELLQTLASGHELSRAVAAALGLPAPDAPSRIEGPAPASGPAAPSTAIAPRAELPAHEVPSDVGPAPEPPSGRGEPRKGDELGSHTTSTPCIATVYTGPGSDIVHGACAVASNEKSEHGSTVSAAPPRSRGTTAS